MPARRPTPGVGPAHDSDVLPQTAGSAMLPPMNDFWIRNATLVTSAGIREADVRVVDETVTEVTDPRRAHGDDDDHVDASGLWLLPGGVDVHTHFGMPLRRGLSSLGWRESSMAALLGGTTTVVDFANPDRDEPIPDAVARWQAAASPDCLCDFGLHATVSAVDDDRLDELKELVDAGIPTFKGFLAYKDRLMLRPDELQRLMERVRTVGGRLLLHAEDGELNARREEDLRREQTTEPCHHPLAHPAESEIAATAVALDAARATGCPLTIVHLSTAGALALIDQARSEGLDIRTEVCIQHLFRNDDQYRAGEDAALTAIMSPPLRPEADALALRTALTEGRLDWIATDHCEFALAAKQSAAGGGFAAVPNGTGGVGERLIVTYSLGVVAGLLTPERWIDLCCTTPAAAAGLGHRKGDVRPGLDADLVLFDPQAVDTRLPFHGAASLWTGTDWRGAVRHVWLRGHQVVESGQLDCESPPGRYLRRIAPV